MGNAVCALQCDLKKTTAIQCPPLILAPLINMSKSGCENKSALLNFKWNWLLRSDETKKLAF